MAISMNDFLKNISSYNLFNYLFPGVVFCLIADKYFSYGLIQSDIVVGVFLYYFVGLIISRIGSIMIEPILKKIGFVKFSEYNDFIAASNNDPKIEILSEVNNMYRTIVSLFFSVAVIAAFEMLKNKWAFINTYAMEIIMLAMMVMFLLAYKKQTNYISKRVEASKDDQ